MTAKSESSLINVVGVDDSKCVNCHACITACPVKYCNNASGDTVSINSDLCIACGNCLTACTHAARYYIDDFYSFLHDVGGKIPVVAIVSPAVAANFPNKYLNLNGWLKSLGVEAVFDVSFGAELTVRSYLDHIDTNKPETVIAQPCAALVTYIEVYQPNLIKYLAPVDSPMVHTMKMIKHFYPQYKNHHIAVLSPCNAKKREFVATGMGDYNIAYKSVDKYLRENLLNLEDFPAVDFDNPPAERAVLFSSPGGLVETVKRWTPEVGARSRKIEGSHIVYDYLNKFQQVKDKHQAPLLVDCLSCEFGCNAGPFTTTKDKSIDEIEYWVTQRNIELCQKYIDKAGGSAEEARKEIESVVEKYWKPGLFDRKYVNRWQNFDIKYPNPEEADIIYRKMHKYTTTDRYNCSSCGYGSCEKMAVAIFNGLNRPQNCHFYLEAEKILKAKELESSKSFFQNIIQSSLEGFIQVDTRGTIVNANQALCQILKRSDLIGLCFADFLDYCNKKILADQLKLRSENKTSAYELTLTDSENAKIDCLISATPLYDGNEHIGSFAMITNISPLKEAQHRLEMANHDLEDRVKERTAELGETLEELRTTAEVIEAQYAELEKLSIVASGTDNAVVIMDQHGNFDWANDAFTRIYGYTFDEFKQTYGDNLLAGSRNPDIRNAYAMCIANQSSVSYEAATICKDGHKIYSQTTLSPIFDSDGKLTRLVAIDADITEMKEAEEEIRQQSEEIMAQTEALLESDQKLKAIIEFIPDPVFVIDEQKKVLAWNRALEKLTGVPAEKIVGKGNYEYAIPFYGERRPILIDYVQLSDEEIERNYQSIHKEGNILYAESFVPELRGKKRYLNGTATRLYDSKGKIAGAIEVVRDITEKRMAEIKLTQANKELADKTVQLCEVVEELKVTQGIIEEYNAELEKLSIVASKTGNAISILDAEGNYEWVNESFERLYGYALDEFVVHKNKNILNVVTTKEAKDSITRAIENRQTAIFEMLTTKKNRERFWVQTTITPIMGDNDKVSKLVTIDTDITRLKDAEHEILCQNEEILAQRDVVQKERDIAERHRQNLTDSIVYASKIQSAILPPAELMHRLLSDHFVLYLPKDIVSGDFYWVNQKENKIILAAADCTGHGVPGGFMSVLGMAFLNEIVNQLTGDELSPAGILGRLREYVISSLHQTGKSQEAKDGMDIALCIINSEQQTIDFAGANNPMFLVRSSANPHNAEVDLTAGYTQTETHGQYELVQIKGDKMPIGIYHGDSNDFVTKSISYQKDDMLYVFSDGYVDQFGGPNNRKFLSKNFRRLLLEMQGESTENQCAKLQETLAQWKGKRYSQVDDILVIGVKL